MTTFQIAISPTSIHIGQKIKFNWIQYVFLLIELSLKIKNSIFLLELLFLASGTIFLRTKRPRDFVFFSNGSRGTNLIYEWFVIKKKN